MDVYINSLKEKILLDNSAVFIYYYVTYEKRENKEKEFLAGNVVLNKCSTSFLRRDDLIDYTTRNPDVSLTKQGAFVLYMEWVEKNTQDE